MLLDNQIPVRYIFNKVKFDLIYVLIIGLLVYYLTYLFKPILPVMPIAIPTFIGTAISILLSFKLNQSYDRWWEARKIWGAIVNDSRSFVLQLQSFISDPVAVKRMAYRQIAWCYTLGQSLRSRDPLDRLERYLSDNDLDYIRAHSNKPLAVLQLNTLDLANQKDNLGLDTFTHIHINNRLIALTDSMGRAERIKSTVFPSTYRLFLHYFIYLFVITLSISLRDIKSYFEIPLLLVISVMFFLVERTAYHLQDPFSDRPTDTAMTAIATTIEINIKQLLNEEDVPKPLANNGFYLL